MRASPLWVASLWLAVAAIGIGISAARGLGKERAAPFGQVTIHTGREGCDVELDASPAGKTDGQGSKVLRDVEPTDHYVHIRCPGEQEAGYFVSPKAGGTVEIHHPPGAAVPAPSAGPALGAAETKVRLRRLIQDAVRLRARGHISEAVQHLRNAAVLDPENSDLHRELGITFLLDKDWKRARIEMLEAIRHSPNDADAHNGLGYALEKLGELEAALKEYRLATHLEPDDASYRRHYLEALGKLAAQRSSEKK